MADHWIAGAVKHKGALHEELGVPEGKTIPKSKLAAAASKGGLLGRRARLAETLEHLGHGGKKKKAGDALQSHLTRMRSEGAFKPSHGKAA